jgi:hypothetical protein
VLFPGSLIAPQNKMKYSLHNIKIYNVDPDTKYSNLTDAQKKKVAMSLHLHHVPQAGMLECKLEILLLMLYSK